MFEILQRGCERGGDFVVGQIHIAHFDGDVALIRNAERVVQSLGEVAEQLLHFLGRVQVVSGTLVPAVGHIDGYILFQAHHDLVGVGILLAEVVRVRCGHDGNVQLPGQTQQLRVDQLLILDAVPLDFNIEILSENFQELLRGIIGTLPVPVRKGFGDEAAQAGGCADDAFVVLFQHLPGDVGLVVEVLEALGGELDEIPVPHIVLCQQDKVISAQLALEVLLVCLHTDNGLLPRRFHGIVILHESVEITMVSQGPGVLGVLHHIGNLQDAVAEGVVAVPVQVRKSDYTDGAIIIGDTLVVVQAQTGVGNGHLLLQKRVAVPEGPAIRLLQVQALPGLHPCRLDFYLHGCFTPFCKSPAVVCRILCRFEEKHYGGDGLAKEECGGIGIGHPLPDIASGKFRN